MIPGKDYRWNITSRGRHAESIDGYFLSYPKSGRTWFRTMLYRYFACVEGVEFSLNPKHFPAQPWIEFTHDRWENIVIWKGWDKLRGKGLIPSPELASKPVLFLARDPRDVVVSLYFQLTRRQILRATKNMEMSEFVRHPRYGVPLLVDLMNGWLDEFGPHRMKMVRYEDCIEDSARAFASIFEFYGIEIVPGCFDTALEFSRFDNMKNMESQGTFGTNQLAAGDLNDKDSFKVRKGKVGGYIEYLSTDDIDFANHQMTRLDPRFGYVVGAGDDA